MNDGEHGAKFWAGNAVLGIALVMLLNMGYLWERLGSMALWLWVALAGVGTFLVMTGQDQGPKAP